jgi:hypothetical protein
LTPVYADITTNEQLRVIVYDEAGGNHLSGFGYDFKDP